MSLAHSDRAACPLCGEQMVTVIETLFCLHCGSSARSPCSAPTRVMPVPQWQIAEPSFAFFGEEGPYPVD